MYSDSYILNCVACDGEGSGDGDARKGMLTKPPVLLQEYERVWHGFPWVRLLPSKSVGGCDGEGSGDGDARTGMLTKPPVQLRGVSTCVAGIFQTGLALLEKELLLYLTTYLRCIVSP